METFEDTIQIDAPVEEVTQYLNKPENWSVVFPSVIEISDVESLENGGHRFEFVYKLAGIRSDSTAEITEFNPSERLVAHIENGMTGDYTFDFAEEEDTTRVTLTVNYELTGEFRTHLIGSAAKSHNNHQFKTLLRTLKNRVELQVHALEAMK